MKTKKQNPKQWLSVVTSLVILSGILISACASVRDQSAEQVIAFTNVNLIPMTSETVIENQTVLVRESKIVKIGASDEVKIPHAPQLYRF
jgi:hypothetical protein